MNGDSSIYAEMSTVTGDGRCRIFAGRLECWLASFRENRAILPSPHYFAGQYSSEDIDEGMADKAVSQLGSGPVILAVSFTGSPIDGCAVGYAADGTQSVLGTSSCMFEKVEILG